MSWKQWLTGELVRAADFQSYLQDQVVAVFADAAERDAVITAPTLGQHAWLTGSAAMSVYDGTRWAGDTGWRKVPMENGFSGDLYVRRIGRTVHLSGINIVATGASGNIMWTTPAGFVRSVANVTVGMTVTAGGGAIHDAAVLGASGVQTTGRTATAGRFSMVYVTDDAWPATLPGSAA